MSSETAVVQGTQQWQQALAQHGYIAERGLAATLNIYQQLRRPLLLEGDAGVGKTQIAQTLANVLNTKLIRLQCYEGLDVNTAVYEWNYQQQLLSIQAAQSSGRELDERGMFSDRFLLQRPLLQAIRQPQSPVLLIDEIDRSDQEFEAFLLEMLADFQITIPELGTLPAITKPYVILTSNGSREISDALRRRCLYYYVDYPAFDKELRIVQSQLPDISAQLARQLVAFVQDLRNAVLRKTPGIAETLDWASALMGQGLSSLDTDMELLSDTLICLLKTREDRELMSEPELQRRLAKAL